MEQNREKAETLQREKYLLEIEKTALQNENANYKTTFKTLEKELKKTVRERDE